MSEPSEETIKKMECFYPLDCKKKPANYAACNPCDYYRLPTVNEELCRECGCNCSKTERVICLTELNGE